MYETRSDMGGAMGVPAGLTTLCSRIEREFKRNE